MVQTMPMTLASPIAAHQFYVTGSPVSVNRYGTPAYRNWRGEVYSASVSGATWSGCLVAAACSVHIRYFQNLDARKDVDNILKAILDGLDGKVATGPKMDMRVMTDDRHVERVVSQRTKLVFETRLDARSLTQVEYAAAIAAMSAQASVFVSVGAAPKHSKSVLR